MTSAAHMQRLDQVPPGSHGGVGEPTAHRRHRKPASPADALQPVLTIRARVPADEASLFIRAALQEIRAHVKSHHVEVEGPPFAICHPAPQGLDVEAGWPVRRAPGNGRIQAGALPNGLVCKDRDQTP